MVRLENASALGLTVPTAVTNLNMNPHWWLTALVAFLVTARAQFYSESAELTSFEKLQTQLDQLELRVSQMSDQLNQITLQQKIGIVSSSISNDSWSSVYGPNWVVMLQRTDGSVNFDRTWVEYRNGFGTVGQDYWIGLEKLHQLTKSSPYELAVEMTDFKGNKRFAWYDRFEIGDEKHRYPIVNLGKHSGTAGNGLVAHTFVGFSTIDRDTSSNCSRVYGNGGWWFYGESCYDSSLTGKWLSNSWSGIVWGKFDREEKWTKLKAAKMMIRAIREDVNVEQD